jgi:hypothetical protein
VIEVGVASPLSFGSFPSSCFLDGDFPLVNAFLVVYLWRVEPWSLLGEAPDIVAFLELFKVFLLRVGDCSSSLVL